MVHLADITKMNNEWYTPKQYVDLIKEVLGEIDIDLASSEKANEIIQAKKYYTVADQSQNIEWCSNSKIFLNPPYDRQVNEFADRYLKSKLKECIVLVNSSTETKWFHKFLKGSNMVAFMDHRISFFDAVKNDFMKNNNKGQAVFYRGENLAKFASVFKRFGCQVCTVVYNEV